MERAALGLEPRASHPADQEPTTHAEEGTGHRARTWNHTLNSHLSISNPVVHSMRATSRRTSPLHSSARVSDGRLHSWPSDRATPVPASTPTSPLRSRGSTPARDESSRAGSRSGRASRRMRGRGSAGRIWTLPTYGRRDRSASEQPTGSNRASPLAAERQQAGCERAGGTDRWLWRLVAHGCSRVRSPGLRCSTTHTWVTPRGWALRRATASLAVTRRWAPPVSSAAKAG